MRLRLCSVTITLDALRFALQKGYAIANTPSVDFELRFTRTSCADTAAQSAQLSAFADQPGEKIFSVEQAQLVIFASFVCAR